MNNFSNDIEQLANFFITYIYGTAIGIGLILILVLILVIRQGPHMELTKQLIRENKKLREQLAEKEVNLNGDINK